MKSDSADSQLKRNCCNIPSRIQAAYLNQNQIDAYRTKWNVPDWAELKKYDYVANLKDDYLRWEFLRRDEKYRELSKDKPRTHFILGNYIAPDTHADKLPDNFSFLDTMRRGGGLFLTPPPISSLLFKKGEPDSQAPQGSIDAYIGSQLNDLWAKGYVIVALDPLRSFDSQKRAAYSLYKDARKEIEKQVPELLSKGSKRKIQLQNATKLLQILDAYNEGLSEEDIGLKFYEVDEDNPYEILKAGRDNLNRALTYWRTL